MLLVKLYMYQIMRSLAYIHSMGICHRDIKPQNLLLDPRTGVLKLCDFGSAKVLVPGEPNVSYICSRYYRAPELIFGATNYTTNIDIWSTGCVMAELMQGLPLFPGESGIDQLVEIIKVLGTPSREQIKTMNPNYMEHKFPQIRPHPFPKIFRPRTPADAIDLITQLLQYTPHARLTAVEALCHPSLMSFARKTSFSRMDGQCLISSTLPERNCPFDQTLSSISSLHVLKRVYAAKVLTSIILSHCLRNLYGPSSSRRCSCLSCLLICLAAQLPFLSISYSFLLIT